MKIKANAATDMLVMTSALPQDAKYADNTNLYPYRKNEYEI
ncbi:MAG: hypothetical protein OXE85_14425 [Roseovarius sp.]|nr:hypothetical protein [Roseovarius sp.]